MSGAGLQSAKDAIAIGNAVMATQPSGDLRRLPLVLVGLPDPAEQAQRHSDPAQAVRQEPRLGLVIAPTARAGEIGVKS